MRTPDANPDDVPAQDVAPEPEPWDLFWTWVDEPDDRLTDPRF